MRHRLPPLALLLLVVTTGCGGTPGAVEVAGPVGGGPAVVAPVATQGQGDVARAADGDSSQAREGVAPPPLSEPERPTGQEGTVASVDGAPAPGAGAACRRDDGAVRVRLGVDTEVVVTGTGEASRMALVGPDGSTPARVTEVFAKLGVVTTIGAFDPDALGVAEVLVSHDAAVPPC